MCDACRPCSPALPLPALHHSSVRAGVPGVKPVLVELTDFKTKQVVDTLEVDAVLVATGRAPFTQVRARTCCDQNLSFA